MPFFQKALLTSINRLSSFLLKFDPALVIGLIAVQLMRWLCGIPLILYLCGPR
jgi:hypothetical protein